MVSINTELGEEVLKSLENIEVIKTDIKERFSQKTVNIPKSKDYQKVLKMLNEDKKSFKRLIIKVKTIDIKNRLKRKIKRVFMRSNNGGK